MANIHEPQKSWNKGLRDQFGSLPVGQMGEAPQEVTEQLTKGCLLEQFGMKLLQVGPGAALVEMTLAPLHMNQRGITQAGAVVALADAAAGWATLPALVEGTHFTTVELKANMLRASVVGDVLHAHVFPVHIGGSTIVLDVLVFKKDLREKPIAKFSCTQIVLRPKG